MNLAKILGWILLLGGVIIIGWTLYSSFNIFTGQAAGPEILEWPKKEVKVPVAKKKITKVQNIQVKMKKMIEKQLKGILPSKVLVSMLNLIAWSILAFILIFGASQIANLGIKLIKT